MLPNCTATPIVQLALSRNHSTPRSGPMASSLRDLEHAAQLQFVRAQKAEQKAEDIQHALNLMLNLGFERFHTARTMDGAVHEFELGTVRNLPASDETEPRLIFLNRRTRRIVLWRAGFQKGPFSASAFHELEFRGLPKNLEATTELRKVVENAIERIP